MRKKIKIKFGSTNFFFMTFLFFLGILYVRLLVLSIPNTIDGINMNEFAKKRNTANIKLYANRGTIYDANKNILATNVSSYTVIAYLEKTRTTNPKIPNHVVDIKKTAEKLSPILNMKVEVLEKLMSQDLYQVELGPGGRDISELKKNQIIELDLPGIAFIERKKRNYPNGDFASYLIGYAKRYETIVEVDGIKRVAYDIVGELGVEAKYDEILKGKDGSLTYQRDRFGYKIPDTKEQRINAVDGQNVFLTIDSGIQRFLEAEVKEFDKTYNPEWIQFTVMDAKTGAILGSSTTPSYNPNTLNIESYENPLVSYTFEPGSTMKTFTYMCAIEKGNYEGDATLMSGSIKIGGATVRDWNNTGWGTITYDKGYEYSSNTAIANLVNNYLTKEELEACFRKYGFGKTTNVGLIGELNGNLAFNYQIETVAAGFGQGITSTALQQLQAMTIIANNGTMLKPYIVEKIEDPNTKKIVYQNEIVKTENIISQATAKRMQEMMYNVVNSEDPFRTGIAYQIDGFDIMGKTGTAQIYDPKSGTYLSGWNDYIYSFSGMYPKEDPKIILYVAMKKPEHSRNAGLGLATRNIIKNISKYLNIFGSEIKPGDITSFSLENYINKETKETEDLKKKPIEVVILGSGNKIIDQYPKVGTKILSGDKIFLLTNDVEIKIPEFKNYSRLEVEQIAKLLKIQTSFIGNGYVVSQNQKAGNIYDINTIVEITFKNINEEIKKEEKID